VAGGAGQEAKQGRRSGGRGGAAAQGRGRYWRAGWGRSSTRAWVLAGGVTPCPRPERRQGGARARPPLHPNAKRS